MIIFLDLDGTLVGDVQFVVTQWELCQKLNPTHISKVKKDVIFSLQNGLLRNGVKEFVSTMTKSYDCSFYIYTAAEKRWANFLVPCIEEAIQFKFNRPILSRQHCIGKDNRKSIQNVLPKIVKSLKRKNKNIQFYNLYNNAMLIDNSAVIQENEMTRWLSCPTYSKNTCYDVLKYIPEELIRRKWREIQDILLLYNLLENEAENVTDLKSKYFRRMATFLTKERGEKDMFFKNVLKVFINSSRTLTRKTIQDLNKINDNNSK